jgi:DNA-binding SARP family transcriptional activator
MLMRVLGPFEVQMNGGRPVDLGGPRQRAVLGVLLSARGEVVSVDRLIEDLWNGEAPPRAIASLQAYVSNLRRVLEPDRQPRTPARILVSAPPGYAIRLPDDAVDAWRFEELLAAARDAHPERAREHLRAALTLWRGAAYAEFADESWATAEAARLEELRLVARELLIDALLRTGDAARAAPQAEVLVRQHPLREEGWRLLALALWAGGRQADALAALRRARTLLADELGLDPGPALTDLERAILAQRVDLLPKPLPAPAAAPHPGRDTAPADIFVGRARELATIGAAATAGSGVVLLTGEAGAGKSAVLAHARDALERDGWWVVVGRCPETEGAPPAWAWVEALGRLAALAPPEDERAPALAPLLDDRAVGEVADAAGGRFRLHRAVGEWLRDVARRQPLAIVLDDLHVADAETLALLASLADAPLLLIAAYRPLDNPERLAETLAVLARRSPHRIQLEGLDAAEVAELVDAVCRTRVDAATVAAVAERTGGNPFYVRESARLLESEGDLVAVSEVPEGVRDVLRRRLARLPQPAVAVLRLAAVVGREADVDVLIESADADENGVLDALEAGLIAGLLTEPAPGRIRFVHALVRDTMYTDLSHLRRTRMHARVAEAIRRLRPDDLSALAHHYTRAASPQTASLAVDYAVRAAELAERRYAHDTAAELLTGALDAADGVQGDRDALRVDLLGRLVRAQIRAGRVGDARTVRERAVDVATACGRDDLLVAAFAAWTVPAPWQTRPYGVVDARAVELLVRLLRRTDLAPMTRCRLLDALTAELDQTGDPRGPAAAQEALTIARGLGDPTVLALGLTASARVLRYDIDAAHRHAIALELREVAVAHGLSEYEWLAEHLLATAAAARGDAEAFRAHVDRHTAIAEAYQLVEAGTVGRTARATIAHIEGRFADAERLYDEAAALMRSHGSPHAVGYLTVSRLTVAISRGDLTGLLPLLESMYRDYGPVGTELMAVAFALVGRTDEARALFPGPYPLAPDYYRSIFATARALLICALDLPQFAEGVMADLLPVRDQLAGAGSTSSVLRPVAHTLGELALLLDRPREAREYFAQAVEVARRWGAPHWAAAARARLASL